MPMDLARALFSIQLGCTFCGADNDFMVAWSRDGSTIFTDGHDHVHDWPQPFTDGPAARNATTGEKIWQGPKVPDDIIKVDAGPLSYSDGRLISTCWLKGSEPPKEGMSYQGPVSFCFFSAENGNLLKVVNTSKRYLTSDGMRAADCGSVDGKYLADWDFKSHDFQKDTAPFELVRIWDTNTGALAMSLDHSNGLFQDGDQVQAMAFSPDGKHLVTVGQSVGCCGDKGMVSIWNLGTRTRKKLTDHTAPRPMYTQRSVAFSPNGTHFATAGGACPQGPCVARDNCTIRVWDVAAGTSRKIETEFKKYCGDKILWSPDGAKIATLSLYYGHWHIWDAVTGECYMDIEIPNSFSVFGQRALWSPDGSHFAWQAYVPINRTDNKAPVHIVPFKRTGCGLAGLVV